MIFSLASVSRIANVPTHLIDRFEIWEKVVFVVFQKGHRLSPQFLSKKEFFTSFVDARKAKSRSIVITKNAFNEGLYTARNTTNGHTYQLTCTDNNIACQCKDYKDQIDLMGRGCCKHGYALLNLLGFTSLIEWQTIEKLRRYPAPSDWPTFTPRSRPTQINGRSID